MKAILVLTVLLGLISCGQKAVVDPLKTKGLTIDQAIAKDGHSLSLDRHIAIIDSIENHPGNKYITHKFSRFIVQNDIPGHGPYHSIYYGLFFNSERVATGIQFKNTYNTALDFDENMAAGNLVLFAGLKYQSERDVYACSPSCVYITSNGDEIISENPFKYW